MTNQIYFQLAQITLLQRGTQKESNSISGYKIAAVRNKRKLFNCIAFSTTTTTRMLDSKQTIILL
jgi:hypothetical protein